MDRRPNPGSKPSGRAKTRPVGRAGTNPKKSRIGQVDHGNEGPEAGDEPSPDTPDRSE